MSNSSNIYFHCVTMKEFFNVLPVKAESLTVFFEENGSEKGWVVSLQVNESDFRKTEISSQMCHNNEKSSLCEPELGTEIPVEVVLFIY